jgi:hypothetical protein
VERRAGLELLQARERRARALEGRRVDLHVLHEPVAVLVKSWEPPLLELQDFLRALRDAVGDGRVVALVPVARGAQGEPAAPGDGALAPWRRAVEQSGDPWLLLHARAEAA